MTLLQVKDKFWGVPNVRLQFNYGNVNDICGDQQPWSFTSARIMPRLTYSIKVGVYVGLWCLTPLSTIFQLYHGG
jgi:hypothetical protein